MFSRRSNFDLAESDFAVALHEARRDGELFDLTTSNPTAVGLAPESLSTHFDATTYHPDPLGMPSARQAVADYYCGHGRQIPIGNITLTASTSESYSFLFRLLCDPGDELLIPTPSYPLFDFLATLDHVDLKPYPLLYDHGWQIDLHALEASITPRTRAILLVHPNNPTGHFISSQEREALYRLATQHSLALIVDEVFLDYPLSGTSETFAIPDSPALTFTLSGLSKVCALPQMKVAWISTTGPKDVLNEAQQRLEVIADTFLSVATPPQLALPTWLEHRHVTQQAIRQRTDQNLARLDVLLQGTHITHITRLKLDAGWTAILRVSAFEPDAELATRLIQNHRVAIHPGSFYGLPPQGYLVVSLLPYPEIFEQGVNQLLNGINPINSPSSVG
ncbi:pyridoxal phosphate-dependent aminotransferase [Terriglobus saanensis]|uniref:alanine transaminase n=1 Tax=Terriglobus saanensis (strain ATCC BAA-1853 / DSM 23119 / SP1PR4) TaxID=401053 RepID=E8V5V3_TERSS|nr:pyridoxal phosphate-dependent aminotransferase [Terriglobus saanensis]ADV82712.1 aminotransferase class I and II [Terriglobus saanensis SP1PR4]